MSRIIVIEVADADTEDAVRMALELAKGHGVTPRILQWNSFPTTRERAS